MPTFLGCLVRYFILYLIKAVFNMYNVLCVYSGDPIISFLVVIYIAIFKHRACCQ